MRPAAVAAERYGYGFPTLRQPRPLDEQVHRFGISDGRQTGEMIGKQPDLRRSARQPTEQFLSV